MYDPYYHRSPRRKRTNIASCTDCTVATTFLLFFAAVGFAVYFSLFKPKDPTITVDAVKFPTFSLSNDTTTVDFTFSQRVSVTNPNHDSFTHYGSSLQLLYSGAQVGFVSIPAGQIAAGQTQLMSANFDVENYPLEATAATVSRSGGGGEVEPRMEIETRMKLVGRVRVWKVLSHRVESRVRCGVVIRVSDGSVLGFHC